MIVYIIKYMKTFVYFFYTLIKKTVTRNVHCIANINISNIGENVYIFLWYETVKNAIQDAVFGMSHAT